ncbi:S-layer homology domain-containing protein [Anaerosphaera multitolerans]|uniref:S-layer homology domain-containing protein n=1 Tax=Anaerosphaera multitolerans TaxID=2487351 RepID=A0A437S4F4_9FIRM|nr:S-layer homology domain-containing protein [Anaerosphaera multitolerans]RVU53880.1 S-layer homology domain-containing protein [Anaerosphaera multitolerans]
MKKKILGLILLLLSTSTVYAKETFNDIKNHWAEQYIVILSGNSYIQGYGDNSFKPNNKISKAEACAVINRAFNLTDTVEIQYSDIKTSDWFYKDVQIASKYKYIDTESKIFSNSPLKRIELIEMLNALYEFKSGYGDYSHFNDLNSFNKKDKDAIGTLFKDGIINGYEDSKFKGDNAITRAEFSKILALCIENYGNTYEIQNLEDESESETELEIETLIEKLKNLIEDTQKINLIEYTKESASNLTLQIFKGEAALNSKDAFEITEAIENIEKAKRDLVYQVEAPLLSVVGKDENGSELEINTFINGEPFENGSALKAGRYLLLVTSPGMADTETHITMYNEDKTIDVTLKSIDDEDLKLVLSPGLESLSGYTFKKNERVTVKVLIPDGMEIDTFLVNSVPKNVIDDEFRFIISEDTYIEVTFK